MKKKAYIRPEAETIRLRISDPVMVIGDLDFGSNTEDSTGSWFGAKENGGFFDEEPFGSLWDEEPVEDPFSIDDY